MLSKGSERRIRGKRLLGCFWSCLPASESRRIILIYHAAGPGTCTVSEMMFRVQMDWLAEHAKVESLDEIVGNPNRTGLRVALTFDDGYRCLYRVVAPVLERYSFPATVFLNTGWIAEETPRSSDPSLGHYPNEQFLLWKEVAELAERGWTIGSHGIEHYDLTALSESEFEREVTASKGEIEARLGMACQHFAYTWGRHDRVVRQAVALSGYSCAVAAHHEPLSGKSDVFALPRLDIRREYSLADFAAVVRGEWDYLGLYHRLKKAI